MEYLFRKLIIAYLVIIPIALALMKKPFYEISLNMFAGFIVYAILIYPKVKGFFGEQESRKQLRKLNRKEYFIINNVYLSSNEYPDKIDTQIDHIVVSIYGIFVIETKNLYGLIRGKEDSEYWMQKNFVKGCFYSPIKQNATHIEKLKKLLVKHSNLKYYSIVTFTPKCTLEVGVETVIYTNKLFKLIKAYKDNNISQEESRDIYKEIKNNVITDKKKIEEYHESIRSYNRKMDEKIEKAICPKCDGNLIKRNGRYGYFLCCSNSPKCGFTISVNS